jgi:DNA-binding beta-propeller fold protein YncE
LSLLAGRGGYKKAMMPNPARYSPWTSAARWAALGAIALAPGCQWLPHWHTVSTWAGGQHGLADGLGVEARFRGPMGLTHVNGALYVADVGNHAIRRIDAEGRVTTFAGGTQGFADGVGQVARFSYPRDVAADAAGNLYVADATNRRIRKITPDGRVSTLAGQGGRGARDGAGPQATFHSPWGLDVAPDGTVFVADCGNHAIRRVGPDGRVTTLAGTPLRGYANGRGAAARFYLPRDVAVAEGGTLYVADAGNHRVRRVWPDGTVATVAGRETYGNDDGPGHIATLGYITGLAVTPDGALLVADETHHSIRRIAPDGTVRTLAGSAEPGWADGPGRFARFNAPTNLALAPGACYVTDLANHRIRKIALD